MNLNATLIAQLVVFLILVFFTMKFVWPPITQALDERAEKIASGLAAADKAKMELSQTHAQTQQELAKAKNESATRLADAERRAVQIIEEAKAQAAEEAKKIIAAAQAEAANQVAQARDALRNQVAALAVRGAEQILRKEINQNTHGELLQQLQRELA